MNIEIEIKSPDAKNDIYELRNYLQQNVEDLQLKIKEEPPQEGQMSIGILGVFALDTVLHVAANISLEEWYQHKLKPRVVQWLQSRKKNDDGSLEILSTLKG